MWQRNLTFRDWKLIIHVWFANFYIKNGKWKYQNFKGTKWININQDISKDYLKNTHRVLLTRARQGMIIHLPEGSDIHHTCPSVFMMKHGIILKK